MRAVQIIWPIEEFGTCLKGILEKRKVSASELARMMAYKSRNSIFRILDDAGGHSARQAFFDRLISENPIELDERERSALEQALEVSRVGKQAFLSNCAMHDMLMNTGLDEEEKPVCIQTLDNGMDSGFQQAMEEMALGKKAHITITGCCDRAIFETLRDRIYEADAACEITVTHLVYTGAEEIVHNISAIQPLLYCEYYTAYCVEPGAFSKEREALYRQNTIHIQTLDRLGRWCHQMLVLVEKGVFMLAGKTVGEENDRFVRYFAKDLSRMPLLKAQLPGSRRVEDYLQYTDSCRKLEAGRVMYTIKPDISLSCIHPDILLPCVKEEFWQMAGEHEQEMKDALCRIHLARWENYFGNRRTNHMIFSREAMERFARTGRQSDHFFAVRPYTPQERVAILANLKRQAQENPYFRMCFFKEAYKPPMTEIGLYEGAGTLMTKPQTHYDLAGDHAEAIITQKEFCERYKEFYVNVLLEHHVISREETMVLMDKLMELARQAS